MEKAAQMVSVEARPSHAMPGTGQQQLPVELQEDLFNAMSDTGLYDIYDDSLVYPDGDKFNLSGVGDFAPARTGSFSHPQDAVLTQQALLQVQQQVGSSLAALVAAPPATAGNAHAMFNAAHRQMAGATSPATAAGASQMAASAIKAAASSAAAEAVTAAAEIRSRLAAASVAGSHGNLSMLADHQAMDSPATASMRRRGSKTLSGSSPGETPGRGGNKGLRHFSLKVCEKVQQKGRTTYNEVADELVDEFRASGECGAVPTAQYDEKNIRRRVYDALNVLMAMEIIQKEKKDIIWRGLPSSGLEEVRQLKEKKAAKSKAIEAKQALLQELVEQQQALAKLMERNTQSPVHEKVHGILHLPFVLIQTERDATVEVFISDDMQNVQLDFGKSPFQIRDDGFLLKQMAASGNLSSGIEHQAAKHQILVEHQSKGKAFPRPSR